jgi:hypothetical protein
MKLQGDRIAHIWITPECRENRTIEGAFAEAADRVRAIYERYAPSAANEGATWHLVLYRDHPDEREK